MTTAKHSKHTPGPCLNCEGYVAEIRALQNKLAAALAALQEAEDLLGENGFTGPTMDSIASAIDKAEGK